MNKTIFKLIFGLIVLIGFLLRFVYLDKYPPGVSWDEISHGYNAYSILKTGRDEWGKKFPLLSFRAYGDYPLPLNLYLTAPFIFVLGLSEFSIRLPHAILGIFTIGSTYFLAYGITKKKNIGVISAFLIAISPWTLFTSRFVLQSNVSVFLLTTSMAFFVNREKREYYLPISFFLLFLTLFSYHSTRIFSPLLVVAALIIYRYEFVKKLKSKNVFNRLSFGILLVFFVALPIIFLNPQSRVRSNWVFIINEGAINKIIEQRNLSSLPYDVKRLIYNRPVYFITEFAKNYLGYFSPKFFFIDGGTQYQFSVPKHGLEYIINLPFFYLGLVLFAMKAFKKKSLDEKLILSWLILAPIPAAMTTEKFAVVRSTTMIPLVEILTAFGLIYAFKWFNNKLPRTLVRGIPQAEKSFDSLRTVSIVEPFVSRFHPRDELRGIIVRNKKINKNIFIFGYFVIVFLLLETYLTIYFGSYSKNYSWSWQYGYKEVVNFAKANYFNYDKIIVTKKYGEPHEFFLFHWPWNPADYRDDPNLVRFFQSSWYWVDRFDKFYFVNDWEIPKEKGVFVLESKKEVIDCTPDTKCLLITSPGNYPAGWQNLKTINFLDGAPAFEIYEN